MKLLINDANILIDIVKLEIVEAFFALDFDLHTTDFVLTELKEYQQEILVSTHLSIITTESAEDFSSIFNLQELNKGLSFEDCSVWYYTRKLNGTLITGDGALRKKALLAGLDVKGIIFILEQIKIQKKFPIALCVEKLEALKLLNYRLPMLEIDKRLEEWRNE